MTNTLKVKFETEPCSRCGGTGEFSFNQLTGTKCFKCGNGPGVVGSGLQLSRRGRAARKRYDELMSRMNRTYGDVVIGDRVKLAFGMNAAKWRTVTAVSDENGSMIVNGVTKSTVSIDCGTTGFTAPADNRVMIWSPELYRAACAGVANMAGATVTGLTDEPVTLIAPLGTPIVNVDGSPVMVAPGTRRSHADCGHERTPKARAKCRAAR